MENKYKFVIFLDVDGVLNHHLFYEKYKDGKISEENRRDNIDADSIGLVNNLIDGLGGIDDVMVVCSSTWRFNHKDVKDLNPLFKKYGAKWEFFERTPNSSHRVRGVEIYEWLKENSQKYFGKLSHDFRDYVILDDDSDMMLWQRNNFFQIDGYCGITYNTVYKILSYFNKR